LQGKVVLAHELFADANSFKLNSDGYHLITKFE